MIFVQITSLFRHFFRLHEAFVSKIDKASETGAFSKRGMTKIGHSFSD